MFTKYLHQKCQEKKKGTITHNHIISEESLTSLNFPFPLTGNILLILAYLAFHTVFFSFLLLMGLIIFSKKIDDSGRGVTVWGQLFSSWWSELEGLLMESTCDLQHSKQRPGFPEQPGHPLLFIRVRAADCQLINRHFLGPSGSQSWSGCLETEAKCACLQQSLHWPVLKPRSQEERRCVRGCERPAVTLGPERRGQTSEQARSSGGPWAASCWCGSVLRATGSVGSRARVAETFS